MFTLYFGFPLVVPWFVNAVNLVAKRWLFLQYILFLLYIVQIMFNKAVMSSLDFPFPMFLTTYHMLLSTVMTRLMAATTSWLPGVSEVSPRQPVYCFH